MQLADWREAVGASDWGRISVQLESGDAFPLRENQQAELQCWLKGEWDKKWLVVRSECPHAFIGQDGSQNMLLLAPQGGAGTAAGAAVGRTLDWASASERRDRLMHERKYYVEHGQAELFEREFSLCEH